MDPKFFHITHVRVGMNHAVLYSMFDSVPIGGQATLQLNFLRINALVCVLRGKSATSQPLHPVIIPDLICRVYQICSLLYLFQLGEYVILVTNNLCAGPVRFPERTVFGEPLVG